MRLLTRSDFDGLASAVLLKHVGVIDHWKFVHPKDMQDGVVEVTENDVLANVPYVPGCGMWFDHHLSETARVGEDVMVKGEYRIAPSAARVIYEYYGGIDKLPEFEEFVVAVDKVDSGQLTIEEIQNPEDWVLLGFMMDPRTGLGRFHDFTIPNYKLMENLIDACASMTIDEILSLWNGFKGRPQELNLPSAPKKFLHYFEEQDRPQTRLERNLENGMAVSLGRLREDSQFDYKFIGLSHNTLRGAAGGAVLLAELLCAEGYI